MLQPLLLRRLADEGKNSVRYEIVAGERRYRAAKKAGLEMIPALVRELSDKEVLEIQCIENLQRADLHPLEEAEGYRQLHEKHGYSVEDLAIKVGKSKAYVYARIKLGALPETAKKLFLEGKLVPSVALLAARIPDHGQAEKFAREAAKPRYSGEPLSYRDAFELYTRDYMLRLAEAPFPTADTQLVPAAGSCSTCPKRTGNQPELFGDIKSADVCTDTVCFGKKRDAWERQQVAALTAAGAQLLTAKESKRIYPHDYDTSPARGYVDLDARCQPLGYGTDKSWRQALKNTVEPAQVLLVREPRGGKLQHVMPEKAARALLKAAGVKLPEPVPDSWSAQRRKDRRAALIQEVVRAQAKIQVMEAAGKARIALPLLRQVTRALCEFGDVSEKTIAQAGERELPQLLLMGLIVHCPRSLKGLCAFFRVDWKKLEADVKADTRKCRACGCTTLRACKGGCSWVEKDLCSRCQKKGGQKGKGRG